MKRHQLILKSKEESFPLMNFNKARFLLNHVITSHAWKLLVFLPRDLDGSDMKVFLRDISASKSVIQGKPQENKSNKKTHRPMFAYFLEWDSTSSVCNGLFDIPTIISSIWDRHKDEIERVKQGLRKEKKMVEVDISK